MDYLCNVLYYLFMTKSVLELPESCRLVIGSQAGLVTCERDWSWAPPRLPDHDAWIVLGGEGQLTVNGATFDLAAGASFVFQPGDHVQGAHDPIHRLRVLYCHFQLLNRSGHEIRKLAGYWPDTIVALHDVSRIEVLGSILLQGVRQAERGGIRAAELALRQILLQRRQDAHALPPAPLDARIARVLHAIQAQPEKQWHLTDMAKVAHVSVSQLRRLFCLATGTTPNAYIIKERVNRACKLLTESNLPLAAIADTLGYRDVYYFNRQFRQSTGTPPAAYRRVFRG